MRILLLALVACTRPAPVTPPVAQPAGCPPAPAVSQPPVLDDPAVIAQSRAFLNALDARDIAVFQDLVGPGFVLFEEQRHWNAEHFVTRMAESNAKQKPKRTRTCKDELVWKSGTAIIYAGLCAEVSPPTDQAASETWEGWNTVVWAQHGDRWKVAQWLWQKGGTASERDMWNETFRRSKGFNQEPNAHLVASVKGRKPGAALDVAMGQGRNALYLASQGWKVTGVDISDEGIRKAKEAAARRKLKLETIEADVDTFDLGTARWDLVTMIYAGADVKLIERIKPSLRRGGLFVVEVFHIDATKGTALGGFATDALAKLFGEGWKVVTNQVVEDTADWGLGKTKLVRFTAQKL